MNVSVVCAVMNRPYRVIPCLRSWAELKIATDVVVVDWSSSKPVQQILSEENYKHHKLNIIRVDGETKFNLGKAYNMAVDNCRNEIVVKVDIDYILTNQPKLINIINNTDFNKQFLHGGGAGAHYLGFSCFNKTHDVKYNVNFKGYGYDDGDLYKRFQNIGLEKMLVPDIKNIFYHIPHDSQLSVANYDVKDITRSTEMNKRIAAGEHE